jgi:hypothetical protein
LKKHLRLLLFILVFFSCSSFAQNGWLWGDGGKGYSFISSLSSDINGNCLALGLHQNDTVQIASYIFPDSTLNLGFFLLKIDPNGNILWAKQAMNEASNPPQNFNNGMTTDMASNIYCTGSFSDSIIFGSTTLVNSIDSNFNETSFLTKYDPNGNIKWAKQFFLKSDTSDITSNGVSTDMKGNCFVTGIFHGNVSIGGQYSIYTNSYFSGFLIKYDSNGNSKWVEQCFGEANPWCTTTDIKGNTIISGDFFDTITCGSDTLRAQNYSGGWVFTVKYDSTGNVLWAKKGLSLSHTIGGGSVGWRTVTDLSGNIYVWGNYSDTIVFAPDTLINRSAQGLFLVKYDPNGNVIWAKQIDILDNNEWYPDGLSIDKYNHIYISGDGSGAGTGFYEIKFGDSTLETTSSNLSSNALFVLRIDSNANVLCGIMIPGGGAAGFSGLASDFSGNNIYVSGPTLLQLVFGQDTITPPITSYGVASFVARWQACDTNISTLVPQNIKSAEQVNLYPNPNNGKFNMQVSVNSGQSSVLEVYNILGEKVFTEILRSTQDDNLIDLSNQPAGLYLYRVIDTNGGLIGSGKVIIEK